MTERLEPARFSSGIPGADYAIVVGLELEKELIAAEIGRASCRERV